MFVIKIVIENWYKSKFETIQLCVLTWIGGIMISDRSDSCNPGSNVYVDKSTS